MREFYLAVGTPFYVGQRACARFSARASALTHTNYRSSGGSAERKGEDDAGTFRGPAVHPNGGAQAGGSSLDITKSMTCAAARSGVKARAVILYQQTNFTFGGMQPHRDSRCVAMP